MLIQKLKTLTPDIKKSTLLSALIHSLPLLALISWSMNGKENANEENKINLIKNEIKEIEILAPEKKELLKPTKTENGKLANTQSQMELDQAKVDEEAITVMKQKLDQQRSQAIARTKALNEANAELAKALEVEAQALKERDSLFEKQRENKKTSDCKYFFGGLGFEIKNNYNGTSTIIRTFDGYPAAAAGLKAGDTIDAGKKEITGKIGTQVTFNRLSISGNKTFTLTRAKICIESSSKIPY